MVKSEVAKLLAVLAAAYSKFEVNDIKLQLWYEMLSDISYEAAQCAVKKYICERSFPPSIADIREAVADIYDGDNVKDAGAAWGEVVKCIRDYGMYRFDEALLNMSEKTAMVVKQISWSEICLCENLSVIRGQFMKMYEILEKRERGDKLMPQGVREQIKRVAMKRNDDEAKLIG